MGKRGPRPTPTHLKLLRGNPGKQAINRSEPQPEIPAAIPEPPAYLDGYAADEWRYIAGQLFYLRLLTSVDIAVLAAYCDAYATWRTAREAIAALADDDPVTHGLTVPTKNGSAQSPLALVARNAAKDMVRFASEFGLTPASRSRISVRSGEPPPSKFAKLISG
jgi:P27 family predicted phage terminase small subunit